MAVHHRTFIPDFATLSNNNFYISPGKDSYAEMDFSGGSFTNKGVFTFGWNGATTLRDTAKIVVSGTADVVMQGNVTMGYSGNRTDYITLDGGRLSVKYLTVGNSGSQGIVTFNGGTLRALESNGDFLSSSLTCNVSAKGAIIDTQSYSRTVSATLAHDSSLGEAVDGGLVKRGAGTLTFTVMPTFTGALCVREGMVVCPGPVANLKGTKETKVSDTRYEYTPCKGVCGFAVSVR